MARTDEQLLRAMTFIKSMLDQSLTWAKGGHIPAYLPTVNSPEYAALQVTRVARVTGLPAARVQQLVAGATAGRMLGFLGERCVNVAELNRAVADARAQ